MYTNLNGDGGGRLYFVNPVTIQENVIDLGAAGSAQYQICGAVVNTIPREGGNQLSGTVFGAYTNHDSAVGQPERRPEGLGPDRGQRRRASSAT